jgi:hypothetical protein
MAKNIKESVISLHISSSGESKSKGVHGLETVSDLSERPDPRGYTARQVCINLIFTRVNLIMVTRTTKST